MKQNVTKQQIVNRLVEVFRGNELALYNSENECRQGVCGWCGVMAPLSRPAYIVDFGLETVETAEAEARQIIAEDRKKYEASEYHSYELEADNHKAMGQPAPQEGSFMWATGSDLKCDGGRGIYNELRNKVWMLENGNEDYLTLVKVEKVYNVTEEAFNTPGIADEIASREDCPGGCWCEEDGDYLDAKKMYYTNVGAVVAPDGRYYLIDNEGYDYARYVLTPLAWKKMFSEEVAKIEEENRLKAETEARQAEEERRNRLADYQARCRKWESQMTEITPYQEEADRLYKEKGRHSKEYKTAERKLHSVKRANILAMCKAAFPGVKFSLKKYDGWGADWEITWEDGPTEKTFSERTNLELFSTCHDTFDGMTDCADVSYEEFTEFAHKYMSVGSCNSIKTDREMSKEKKAELIAEVVSIVPEFDIKNSYGYYDRYVFSYEQAETLVSHFKMSNYSLFGNHPDATAEEIARRVWVKRDYLTEEKPEETTKIPTLKTVGNNGGLELIDYSEKAVAIIGNTRDYAEKLKELGGRFNGKLKCGAGWIFSKKRESELKTVFSL